MSNDLKLTVGICVIVMAIFGSAWLLIYAMIEVSVGVRADLHALRESMEAIACGEFARNDAAVAGIESSNRPRQWPALDRPTATTRRPVDAWPNGDLDDGTLAFYPWLTGTMSATSPGGSSGPTTCLAHSTAPRRFR